MCPSRRRVKFALPLAAAAAVGAAAVVRSRRDVEVWHVAPDVTPGDPPENPEGP